MPNDKRPLKVFLCHAHADRDAVRALYTRLIKDGVDAWLDKEKLVPGQDWELEIRDAVRNTDLVIVCLSKQFNQAGFRQKEVRLALDTAMEQPEGEIFIIPARFEKCDTLRSLEKWHWVDLFEDDGYLTLTRALSLRAERLNATFSGKTDPTEGLNKLAEHRLSGDVEVLSNLGSNFLKKRDFKLAVRYFERALLLSQELADTKSEATILSQLASAYEDAGDLVAASEFYGKIEVDGGDWDF